MLVLSLPTVQFHPNWNWYEDGSCPLLHKLNIVRKLGFTHHNREYWLVVYFFVKFDVARLVSKFGYVRVEENWISKSLKSISKGSTRPYTIYPLYAFGGTHCYALILARKERIGIWDHHLMGPIYNTSRIFCLVGALLAYFLITRVGLPSFGAL